MAVTPLHLMVAITIYEPLVAVIRDAMSTCGNRYPMTIDSRCLQLPIRSENSILKLLVALLVVNRSIDD